MDESGNIYTANNLGNSITKIAIHGIADLAGNYNTASTSTNNEVLILAGSHSNNADSSYSPSLGGGWPTSYSIVSTTINYASNNMILWIQALQRMLDRTATRKTGTISLIENITSLFIKAKDINGSPAKQKIISFIRKWYLGNSLYFQPKKKMTRYEFVKIISLTNGFTSDIQSNFHFIDIQKRSKAERYVAYAAEMGWINGEDMSFRPNENITLWEAQEILDAVVGDYTSMDGAMNWNTWITKETWVTMIVDQLRIE